MWILSLNPMQEHTECSDIVAWSETKEELEAFIARERVEPYMDEGDSQFTGSGHRWGKSI